MTGIFRANNPLNTFLLFVYGILLKLVWFVHPLVPVAKESNGFLFNNLLGVIKPTLDPFPVTYAFITYLLLFTQAVSFNQLLNSRRLMQRPNYLPAMSYLLITSFFVEWNVLSGPLIINTFMIWIWAKMTNLYGDKHAKTTLYNIGLIVGLASFLYFSAITFGLLVIFALLIMRPPKVAEWLIALIGIFTPWYFLFVWLFLTDKLYSFYVSEFRLLKPVFHQNAIAYIAIIFIISLAMIGGFFVQSFSTKQVVQVRKSWSLMLLYLIVAMFVPFINISHNFEYWLLAVVPLSAFVGCAFFYPKIKWIPMVLHWMMVGFVIYMQYLK